MIQINKKETKPHYENFFCLIYFYTWNRYIIAQ